MPQQSPDMACRHRRRKKSKNTRSCLFAVLLLHNTCPSTFDQAAPVRVHPHGDDELNGQVAGRAVPPHWLRAREPVFEQNRWDGSSPAFVCCGCIRPRDPGPRRKKPQLGRCLRIVNRRCTAAAPTPLPSKGGYSRAPLVTPGCIVRRRTATRTTGGTQGTRGGGRVLLQRVYRDGWSAPPRLATDIS